MKNQHQFSRVKSLSILDEECNETLVNQFKKYKVNDRIADRENLCIMIRGQLRTFHKNKVINSLKHLVNQLTNRFNVVCFFLINKESTFEDSPWHYQRLVDRGLYTDTESARAASVEQFKLYDEKNNEKFDRVIDELGVEVRCETYTSEFAEKYKKTSKGTTSLQEKLTSMCSSRVKEYEKEHGIEFNYVITTRPDLKYEINVLDDVIKKISSKFIFTVTDCVRIYPRHIFNFLLKYEKIVTREYFESFNLHNWFYTHLKNVICLKLANADVHGYVLEYGRVWVWGGVSYHKKNSKKDKFLFATIER